MAQIKINQTKPKTMNIKSIAGKIHGEINEVLTKAFESVEELETWAKTKEGQLFAKKAGPVASGPDAPVVEEENKTEAKDPAPPAEQGSIAPVENKEEGK